MKRLLITGCNGLLGSALSQSFQGSWEVLGLDLNSGDSFPFQEVDIRDCKELSQIMEDFHPHLLVNAAALTDVDECEREREKAWDVNVKGVENIASLCSEFGCKLIHLSTDYIFDGKAGPYSEGDSPSPCNYYGKTKWESERVLERFPLDWAIVRTSALYGLHERGKVNFFSLLLDRLSEGKGVYGFVDQYNTPTYVGDLVEGIKKVTDKRGLFHISGGEFLNRFDFAQKVANVLGFDSTFIRPKQYNSTEFMIPRPLKGGLKIDKAQSVLRYRPHSVEEALELIKTERKKKDASKK